MTAVTAKSRHPLRQTVPTGGLLIALICSEALTHRLTDFGENGFFRVSRIVQAQGPRIRPLGFDPEARLAA
jgi:hypothetical protein